MSKTSSGIRKLIKKANKARKESKVPYYSHMGFSTRTAYRQYRCALRNYDLAA